MMCFILGYFVPLIIIHPRLTHIGTLIWIKLVALCINNFASLLFCLFVCFYFFLFALITDEKLLLKIKTTFSCSVQVNRVDRYILYS
jgi:protein-S-isoprenylcysteine O-methyltransferase Ste14